MVLYDSSLPVLGLCWLQKSQHMLEWRACVGFLKKTAVLTHVQHRLVFNTYVLATCGITLIINLETVSSSRSLPTDPEIPLDTRKFPNLDFII